MSSYLSETIVVDDDNIRIDDGDVFATVLVVEMDDVSSEGSGMVLFIQYSGGLSVNESNLPRSESASNRKVGRCSLVQDIVSCRSLSKVSRNDIICDEIYLTLSTMGRR